LLQPNVHRGSYHEEIQEEDYKRKNDKRSFEDYSEEEEEISEQ
jgi:hypothetical protein